MELTNSVFAARLTHGVDQLREAFGLGFERLVLTQTDPPLDPTGLADALVESGGRVPALEFGCLDSGELARQGTAWFAGRDDRSRTVALQSFQRHVRLAASLKASRVLLVPAPLPDRGIEERLRRVRDLHQEGREAQVTELIEEISLQLAEERDEATDRLCRVLHALLAAAPGLELAFVTPELPGCFPDEDALEFLFEDLSRHAIHYWHDTARSQVHANLVGGDPTRWFDRFGSRLRGAYLNDAEGLERGLLPGEGQVDFKALRSQLTPQVTRVLHLRAGSNRQGVLGARYAFESLRIA